MRTVLTVLTVLSVPTLGTAQEKPKAQVPAVALATAGLAGANPAGRPLPVLGWADSLLGEVLSERAPEVTWVLPPSLRSTARRATGLLSSPDQMGQAVMRAPNLKEVPDPLRRDRK